MAHSIKLKPFWKKHKSPRIEKETKTTLKNKMVKTFNHETEDEFDDYISFAGEWILIMLVFFLFL